MFQSKPSFIKYLYLLCHNMLLSPVKSYFEWTQWLDFNEGNIEESYN